MKRLRITLKPLEPYFLGSERTAAFGDYLTQGAKLNPYYLSSNEMPSQSALFGVLRYLGIRNPKSDYDIRESEEFIGSDSFRLTNAEDERFGKIKGFGKIQRISELMLTDEGGNHYVVAPRNGQFDKSKEWKNFVDYVVVRTLHEERWIPRDYSVKDSKQGQFVCLETGEILDTSKDGNSVFLKQTRVGINRQLRDAREDRKEQSGFFKREYVILNSRYQFCFYADLEDDAFDPVRGFTASGHREVMIGQGRAVFLASWQEAESPNWSKFKKHFPKIQLNGHPESDAVYAYAKSPLFIDLPVTDLKDRCRLIIVDIMDYREFATNYGGSGSRDRYRKGRIGLKLLRAGSVMLFANRQQREEFVRQLKTAETFARGEIAGFNQLYYPDDFEEE